MQPRLGRRCVIIVAYLKIGNTVALHLGWKRSHVFNPCHTPLQRETPSITGVCYLMASGAAYPNLDLLLKLNQVEVEEEASQCWSPAMSTAFGS